MNELTWKGYSIKRLSGENLNDLALLHQEVYGRESPQKYFQRKYDTYFTGILYTGCIAYDTSSRPVAFYGVIPCFVQYGADKILAAQSADTMTHPLHRNKGLFVALADLTVELCRAEGIRVLFGFPNQHSLPGFVGKLQWHLAGYMACFILPVKTLPLERVAVKFKGLRPVYKWYTDHQIKKCKLPLDGLANTFAANGFAGVYRDDSYLKYKTCHPTIVIKIKRTNVWFKVKNGLTVGDITISDDFEQAISRLKNLARDLGLTQVMFQVSKGTPLYSLLLNYAEPSPGFPVILKDLNSGIPIDKLKFTFADIDIF